MTTDPAGGSTPATDGAPAMDGAPAPDGDELVEIAHHCFDLARQGRTDDLVAYLSAGVPVDLTDARGNTLVMLAAYHGHAATTAALCSRGADADRANDRGQTPLAGAVFKVEADVVSALVAAGADPDAGTPSARETAVFFGRPDITGLLPQTSPDRGEEPPQHG